MSSSNDEKKKYEKWLEETKRADCEQPKKKSWFSKKSKDTSPPPTEPSEPPK